MRLKREDFRVFLFLRGPEKETGACWWLSDDQDFRQKEWEAMVGNTVNTVSLDPSF